MSNSELAQRFVRLEAGSRMRLVACKLAAGSWQDVGNTAMGYLSDAGTAVRQGLDAAGGAAMDYLESPTLGEVQQGAADGKLLFDQEQAGVLPTVSLNPRPPMDWSERTSKLLNNPSAVGRMALIGGGIAAGSLATSVMRRMAERRRRRVAMRELERMGIKLSEFDWKQWAGQGAQEAGRAAKQVGSQGVEAVKQWSAVPENQRNAKLVGGGAVVGAVLTTLVKRRAEKRRARALGQALNIKRADGEWWRQYTDPLAAGATKMMSNYQLGSQLGGIKDRAAGGIEHLKNLIRRGLSDPKQRAYVTAALGAAAGGGVAGMTELMSGRRKKRYLNAVLSGATGGALAGGALGYMTNPSAQQTDAPSQSLSAALDPSAEAERILALPPADREAAVQQLSDTERELMPSLAELYPQTTGSIVGAAGGITGGEMLDRYDNAAAGNRIRDQIDVAERKRQAIPDATQDMVKYRDLQDRYSKLLGHHKMVGAVASSGMPPKPPEVTGKPLPDPVSKAAYDTELANYTANQRQLATLKAKEQLAAKLRSLASSPAESDKWKYMQDRAVKLQADSNMLAAAVAKPPLVPEPVAPTVDPKLQAAYEAELRKHTLAQKQLARIRAKESIAAKLLAGAKSQVDARDVLSTNIFGLNKDLDIHKATPIKRPLGKLTGRGLIGAAVGLGLSQVPKLFGSAPQPADPATLYSAQLNNN